ncbi:MAG: acyl-ACP--UDP-N-acetylglucosamine O-acyltransferase [Pseudomonadota bacterium]|nr:acyl-ACP--UDP-N-acetylglucosamine O-acyltransferase [Pseudomonadota bacterium]
MSFVHPSACVEPGAVLGADVEIGPFCHVGAQARLGEGVRLVSHVVVAGATEIGARTRIFPFASIGHEPQDLKYRGEATRLKIGADCLIREGVTMNPGTEGGGGETVVGDRCVFLAQSHVAHDCRLGEGVLLSNNVMLAGHCQVGDHAIFGGGSAAHQFVRIGAHAFVGGLSGVTEDLIPFGVAIGNRARLGGVNVVGMKRRGFSLDDVQGARRAYKLLFGEEGTLKARVEQVAEEFADNAAVREIVAFLREGGDRAVTIPRERGEASA